MRIIKLLNLSALFICISTSIIAQIKRKIDTTKASHYYQRGIQLLHDDQYDSLNHYFSEAAAIFSNGEYTKRHLECLNKLAESLHKIGDYNSSILTSQKVLSFTKTNEELKSVRSIALLNLGIAKIDLGEADSADFYLHRAGKILIQENKDFWNISKLYSNLGRNYCQKGIFDLSIYNYELGLSNLEKILTISDPKFAVFYGNIGIVYSELQEFERAIEMYKKGYSLILNKYGNDHPFVSFFLNNIGLIYFKMGLYHEALTYYNNAIAFTEKNENNPALGSYYANTSDTYRMLNQYDNALLYNKKASDYITKHFGPTHHLISMIESNKADIYFDQKRYQESLDLKLKAINKLSAQLGDNHHQVILLRSSLAITYSKIGHIDKAIQLLTAETKNINRLYENKNIWSADLLHEIGTLYEQKNDFKNARYYFQQSLIANVKEFNDSYIYSNPAVVQSLHPLLLLKSLKSKAFSIINDPNINSQNEKIEFALSTFKSCDELIKQLRHTFLNNEDKLALSRTFSSIYEGGIKTSLDLFQSTKDPYYLDQLLLFIDGNKGTILSESINIRTAAKSGLLPKKVLDAEEYNLSRQSYFQSKINQQHNSTQELKRLKKELFSLKQNYDTLLNLFKEKYPLYFQLRYQHSKIATSEIQSNLPDHTASIEYYEGDSIIYVLGITKNDIFASKLDKKTLLNNHIAQFRNAVNLWSSGKYEEEAFSMYVSSSNSIFNYCLKDVLEYLNENQSIENLIIIPDGKLYYVPFETLLTDSSLVIKGDYQSLNYLILNYSISYDYSSRLLFQKNKTTSKHKTRNYLGFAPIYPPSENNKDSIFIAKRKNQFKNLNWNISEIENIANIIKGDVYLNEQADESNFKKELTDYKVVHLAMHALVNDIEPMSSKLVFYQNEKDSIEDGFLHTYELLNSKIDADLAVLSACNTGVGKLEKGEGIRSLAYGFSAAGCLSTVMSQWPVDDQSTSILLQCFYKNLNKGFPKNIALRNAKIEMISSMKKAYANPYYWGAFVLYGKTDSILFIKDKTWISLTLISMASLIMIGFYIKRKKSCPSKNSL